MLFYWLVFFFQAEDGIRDLVRSRGLGDVYKRQRWDRGDAKDGHCRGGGGQAELEVHLLHACEDLRLLSLIHI